MENEKAHSNTRMNNAKTHRERKSACVLIATKEVSEATELTGVVSQQTLLHPSFLRA